MSNYSFLNILKSQSKSLQRAYGLSRAQALELIAGQHGFSNYHELQTVAKRNPTDARLMKAALGTSDLAEVIYEDNVFTHFEEVLESHLSSEIAMTNASNFTVENLEVLDAAYADSKGDLFIEIAFEYDGEQDPDRVYSGKKFYVSATLMLLRRNGEWVPYDAFDGLEIHEIESDTEFEYRLEMENSRAVTPSDAEA